MKRQSSFLKVSISLIGFLMLLLAPEFFQLQTAVAAQQTYSVSGRVVLGNTGMGGVTININGPNSPTVPPLFYTTETNADGSWSISGIRAGIVFYAVSAVKPGYVFSPCPLTFATTTTQLNFSAAVASLSTVSAADFNFRAGFCSHPTVAQESIASTFGTDLAATTQIATSQPLPTVLAGTSVKIKDAANTEREAPLFFVSPTQINFQVPPGTALGTASINIVRNGQVVKEGNVHITDFQLTLFTADASGKGFPAAVAYRLKANGAESYEPISRFDPVQGKLVAVPIEFGDETEQLFLVLFGTGGIVTVGVGNNTQTNLQSYEITIGGTPAQVTYVGLQPSYVGLVQTNVLLPRSLMGRGDAEVKLRAIGREANPVTINIR